MGDFFTRRIKAAGMILRELALEEAGYQLKAHENSADWQLPPTLDTLKLKTVGLSTRGSGLGMYPQARVEVINSPKEMAEIFARVSTPVGRLRIPQTHEPRRRQCGRAFRQAFQISVGLAVLGVLGSEFAHESGERAGAFERDSVVNRGAHAAHGAVAFDAHDVALFGFVDEACVELFAR